MTLKDYRQTVGALIVAAGMSSRMGDFKPMMPLRGKTLIENTVDSVLEGGANALIIVVGYRGEEISALFSQDYGEHVTIAWNPDYACTDMLRSIQIGLSFMPACRAFFLLPGDMPVIHPNTFRYLLDVWKGGVVFPVQEGRKRHPPLIDYQLVPEIMAFQGEDGLRGFWRLHPELIHTVPVEDAGVRVDLDTQADYRNCRMKYEH